MAKILERDLNLYAVTTISIGAMIGSGIFVLPGLATKFTGPSIILAYFLAGLIVIPAALSKAEMATAMPESGGTYLYIDRALGPLMGTIAGLGVWFSLTFKSAFALVGLGAYLVVIADLPTKPVSIGLAVLLVVVNILGVKQTGRLQSVIVSGVLAVLFFFITRGAISVESVHFEPFITHGFSGLLAATGFVFVSYAGVTKIASVAEEVINPERNIPIAIMTSVFVMMAVYVGVSFVIVGVSSGSELTKTLTPMLLAAEQFLGSPGVVIIAITAVLALLSMANAGILATSRYPFAMSRGSLAPKVFQRIHPGFKTPVNAILVTGVLLVTLIAFVPVVELAKLASAFKILIFCLVNLALIAFRESRLESYNPPFRSPFYPWVQIFGLVGGVVLLTQMGITAFVGALAIIVAGILWFAVYGRPRTQREGIALEALRRSDKNRGIELTEKYLADDGQFNALIPVSEYTKPQTAEGLLILVSMLVPQHAPGKLEVVRFTQVPDQLELDGAQAKTPEDVEFENYVSLLAGQLGRDISADFGVSHDWKSAIVAHVKEHRTDLIITEEIGDPNPLRPFSRDSTWLAKQSSCDTLVLHRSLGSLESIAVLGAGGPLDAMKVSIANRLASESQATIHFIHVVKERASEDHVLSVERYHQQLGALCSVETRSTVLRSGRPLSELEHATSNASLTILGASSSQFLASRFGEGYAYTLAKTLTSPVLLVHSQDAARRSFLGALLERLVY